MAKEYRKATCGMGSHFETGSKLKHSVTFFVFSFVNEVVSVEAGLLSMDCSRNLGIV
jgi:hypothetical protein